MGRPYSQYILALKPRSMLCIVSFPACIQSLSLLDRSAALCNVSRSLLLFLSHVIRPSILRSRSCEPQSTSWRPATLSRLTPLTCHEGFSFATSAGSGHFYPQMHVLSSVMARSDYFWSNSQVTGLKSLFLLQFQLVLPITCTRMSIKTKNMHTVQPGTPYTLINLFQYSVQL